MAGVQVRSCTLDTWLPEQVAFMARTGNAKANAYYEAKLDSSQKPSYYSPDLEPFIRRKVPHPEMVLSPGKLWHRNAAMDVILTADTILFSVVRSQCCAFCF